MLALRTCSLRPLLCRSRVTQLQCRGAASTVKAKANAKAKGNTGTHWSKERLVTTPKYPLSEELCEKAGRGLGENVKARRIENVQREAANYARTQVVSPQLCDDVLNYIGHTLDKHKGCDIIDINPGGGLWSTKLHEYLQPRRHILLEPAMDKYGAFLQPLLDAPDSKYHLVAKDPCDYDSFLQLIDEGYLPDQKGAAPGESPPFEVNNSLLVIGSLMWEPTLPGYGYTSMAKQFMYQQAGFSWKRSFFHKFGPVRMLLWAQSEDFKSLLPRGTTHINKTDIFTKMVCNVTEVVQPVPKPRAAGSEGAGREPRYNLESMVQALKRGKENGMEYPEHRRTHWHDMADEVARMTDGTGNINSPQCEEYLVSLEKAGKSTVGMMPERFRDALALQEEFKLRPERWLDMEKKSTNRLVIKGGQKYPYNTEGRKLRNNLAQISQVVKKKAEVDHVVDVAEQAYHLECKIIGMADGSEKDAALEELKQLNEQVEADYNAIVRNWQERVMTDMDDRCSIRYPGLILQWDKRPFEPLVAQTDEVWPAAYVSLGDFQPLPIPTDHDDELHDYVHDFAAGLFSYPNLRLAVALENMEHGASELIDQVPSLKEPAKGGRLDTHNMRVRMLTTEMVVDLYKAYRDWPFKDELSAHPRYFQLKLSRRLRGASDNEGVSPYPNI
ncbi:hypothetical protein BDV96DRAFT_609026 [Lophiotrema nucula]|uniref:rRNA adenine N(6)-methyltransferase n=1 Tax=Lophiotrema nucula TaxID=690887 RepID=A0A6A5ZU72_9PLEO|nr:hypothetical protein BDV96DRAFT_609026 [Lophiotrema nucula]